MRHLNKIIFINSATVLYHEILLDGNVHFVGTQGVGKSTILRAILFFYNADGGKLGIPREKDTFAEYYFQKSNSFIIYEVARETGPFCILAYKQSGRIAYRFIDAAYQRDYFIAENKALEGWDKIRPRLDNARISYSRKIERYEEYRNILYGNNEGRTEFKKYALLESKLFQNIPRTIQNVFLNAKLEADFIKKTMIDSLMEENVSIDLGVYRHHLQEFENEYKDIETFKNKKVQERAEKIIQHHNHIVKAIADKREDLLLLNKAVINAEKKKPLLEKKIGKYTQELSKERDKLSGAETTHATILTKINLDQGAWLDKAKTAAEKKKHYETINIADTILRVNKEPELVSKQKNLRAEQVTITQAFSDIETKYKTLLDNLTNEQREFDNIQREKKIRLQQTFGEFKDLAQLTFDKLETEIKKQFKGRAEKTESDVQNAQKAVNELEKKEALTKASRFFEQELEMIRSSIRLEQALVLAQESQIKVSTAEKDKLSSKLETDTNTINRAYEQDLEKSQDKLKAKEHVLAKLKEWINSSSVALFGFLNDNYPSWESTIGKVCKEEIIFNADLAPELLQVSNLLFGVKLELGDIETTVKTLDGYTKEKDDLEKEIENIKTEIIKLDEKKTTDLEKLKKISQPKIREHIDAIQQSDFAIETSKSKQTQLDLDLADMEKKSAAEKIKALDLIVNQLSGAKQDLAKAITAKNDVAGQLEEQIGEKRIDKETKVGIRQAQLNNELAEIDALIISFKTEVETRRKNTQDSKHAELQGKGLDTKRLKVIETDLKYIADELDFISNNQKLVFDYLRDTEEYLSKIEDFNKAIEAKEKEKQEEEASFSKTKVLLLQQITKVDSELTNSSNELEQTEKQLKSYEEFKLSKEFQAIEPESNKSRDELMLHSIPHYIDKIKEAHYLYVEELNSLTSSVNDFTGRFSAGNIFSFKTGFAESTEYIAFAQTLKEFMDENKIAEFEKRVNNRYAEIIHVIDREITNLLDKEGAIQQVISKINKDFQEKEKNFVSAISLIEIKIEDSTNRIVDVLKRIKNFNADGRLNTVGNSPNLFSSDTDERRINEAIGLLTTLVKEIRDSKNATINIADSFELRFRVIENLNDSGWVEKLSNIGSEGTDILVKAMINIMLLNVFKESASRKFKSFKLHCMMDEIGRLHPGNVRGILKFANDRNILLINGSPIEHDALAYKHIYELRKDEERYTRVKRLISVK